MSSGGKGNSRASTSSQSSTTNEQTTVNQVDNRVFDLGDGSVVVGDGTTGGVNITTTDHGAIERAADLARGAFDAGTDVALEGINAGNELARVSLDNNLELTQDALGLAERLTGDYGDFTSGLFAQAFGAVKELVTDSSQQLGNTVTNLNAIARENSKSADERITGIAEKTMLAAVVVVGLVVAAMVFRKARAA